ncbi:hypothetical protein GCM10009626_31130 [Brachybacterium sacelli]
MCLDVKTNRRRERARDVDADASTVRDEPLVPRLVPERSGERARAGATCPDGPVQGVAPSSTTSTVQGSESTMWVAPSSSTVTAKPCAS